MAQALLAAFGCAVILSGGALGTGAAAMTLPRPATLGIAPVSAPALQRVAVVCGMNGCARVQVVRVRRPPPGFVKRGAPLVFPAANASQIAPENK
jgi:hypothetical protein